jgi:hypothetical protein
MQCVTSPGTRRRLLQDAENDGGEVSFDRLMGARHEERYHAAGGRRMDKLAARLFRPL